MRIYLVAKRFMYLKVMFNEKVFLPFQSLKSNLWPNNCVQKDCVCKCSHIRMLCNF